VQKEYIPPPKLWGRFEKSADGVEVEKSRAIMGILLGDSFGPRIAMGKVRAEEIDFNFLFNTIFLWHSVACV